MEQSWLEVLISAFIPAFLIASLFYYLDKNKEPIKAILRAFILGMISIPVVFLLYEIIPGSCYSDTGQLTPSFFLAFWDAAFHEELAKLIVFVLGIYSIKYFDEWYDGILYGVMIGLGFAFLENIQYFLKYFGILGYHVVYMRSILSMPLHALAGAVMGYFIGKVKFTVDESMIVLLWIISLLAPITIHGLFNFVLMYSKIDLRFFAWLLVFFLWYKVIKLKKKTQMAKYF